MCVTCECVRLIRYADDFVACFATQADAERFNRELVTRLAKFGLEVEPTKTKVLAFGPGAVYNVHGKKGRRGPTHSIFWASLTIAAAHATGSDSA